MDAFHHIVSTFGLVFTENVYKICVSDCRLASVRKTASSEFLGLPEILVISQKKAIYLMEIELNLAV
jgi:hypothetical protein